MLLFVPPAMLLKRNSFVFRVRSNAAIARTAARLPIAPGFAHPYGKKEKPPSSKCKFWKATRNFPCNANSLRSCRGAKWLAQGALIDAASQRQSPGQLRDSQ